MPFTAHAAVGHLLAIWRRYEIVHAKISGIVYHDPAHLRSLTAPSGSPRAQRRRGCASILPSPPKPAPLTIASSSDPSPVPQLHSPRSHQSAVLRSRGRFDPSKKIARSPHQLRRCAADQSGWLRPVSASSPANLASPGALRFTVSAIGANTSPWPHRLRSGFRHVNRRSSTGRPRYGISASAISRSWLPMPPEPSFTHGRCTSAPEHRRLGASQPPPAPRSAALAPWPR